MFNRFRKIATAGIVLSAAWNCTAIAAPVNLVMNGSFENGLAGWTHGGSFISVAGIATAPAAAITFNSTAAYPVSAFGESIPTPNDATASSDAAGLMGAYFVDDGAVNESLSQFVFLSPGFYRIGFDVYAPNNGYANPFDARFSAQIAGMTLANYMVSSEPAATWLNFSGVADITTAGNYSVSFLFNTPGRGEAKDVVVDRVFITANVPEPDTLPLMALAGGAMTMLSLRKRRVA